MLAKGLAMSVSTCVRAATTSPSPGNTAQPPASTTWSTWLNGVEVKKNCKARETSSARLSMKGTHQVARVAVGQRAGALGNSASSKLMPYWRAMSPVNWPPPECSRE